MTVETQATVPAAFDIDAILATLPPEVQVEGRQRLAAIAAAATVEERARIQAQVVNETLKAAQAGNWCLAAERALTAAFGEPEGGRWILADGFDRDGIDRDGYNRDGYHFETGRNRDGFDRHGRDADGYDKDGLDQHGYNREGLDKDGRSAYRFNADGWDPEGFDREGFDRDGFDRRGWNREGIDRDGRDQFRYDSHGCDRDGYNGDGFDYYGRTREMNAELGYLARPASNRRTHPRYAQWAAWNAAGSPVNDFDRFA